MIKRAEDMVKLYNEHMRDGDGTVEIIRYLEPEEFNGNAKMIAKLVLKRDVLSASIHMKVKKKLFVLQREMQNTMTTAQW